MTPNFIDSLKIMEKILNTKILYQDKKLLVRGLDIDFGNGNRAMFERVESVKSCGNGVIIAAIDDENHIFLIEQYQAGADRRFLVLPRWGIEDANMDPSVKANEELQEEVGMHANTLTKLTTLDIHPGWLQMKTTLFLAQDLVPSEREGDEIESIVVRRMPFTEAIEKIMSGEITDARTVAGLFYVKHYLKQ